MDVVRRDIQFKVSAKQKKKLECLWAKAEKRERSLLFCNVGVVMCAVAAGMYGAASWQGKIFDGSSPLSVFVIAACVLSLHLLTSALYFRPLMKRANGKEARRAAELLFDHKRSDIMRDFQIAVRAGRKKVCISPAKEAETFWVHVR